MQDSHLARSPNFILFLIADDDVLYSAQSQQNKTWITQNMSDLKKDGSIENVGCDVYFI